MELPSQGESFQRKYKLHEVLGKGGFAAVYRATDVEIGRDVAIKVLAPSDDGYSKGIESRFMREARVIASLQDPHTITMFEFGRSEDGLLFMVFEYVKGIDLSLLIRRRPLSEDATIHILKQVLQSLREAHAAGVLHRDLKPANILIYEYMDDEHRAKLLDFGIAKPVAGAGDGLDITSDGAMIGTPRYMAPEQIYAGELTPASDIYSLGLVAYEMLVGEPAIKGRTTKEMMVQQLSDTPVQLPPDLMVSPALRSVINRMTTRDPGSRFASADLAIQALEFAQSNSGPIHPPSGPVPAWSPYSTGAYGGVPGSGPQNPPPQYPSGQAVFPYGPQVTPPPTASGVHPSWSERAVVPQQGPRREPTRPGVKDSNWALAGAGLAVGAGIVSVLMLGSYLMKQEPEPEIADTRPPKPEPKIVRETVPEDVGVPVASTDAGADHDQADGSSGRALGCGKEPGWDRARDFSLSTGSGRRKYSVYLPKGYDKDKPHPVVMLFHKAFNDGDWIAKDTRIRPLADQQQFVVMTFDAADRTQPWGERDLGFVESALDAAEEAACLDRGRIFAVGHGAGGDFTRWLACSFPLAGIGTAGSGEARGSRACSAKPPVPFIRMAGLDDNYLPADGGSSCLGGEYKSIEEIDAEWRSRNACKPAEKTWRKNKEGTCLTWDCEAPFVSCRLQGGHDWPDSTPEKFEMPGCPHPPPKFRMMEAIWDFFAEQQSVDWHTRYHPTAPTER